MSRFSPIDWLVGTLLVAHGSDFVVKVVRQNKNRTGVVLVIADGVKYRLTIEKVKVERKGR